MLEEREIAGEKLAVESRRVAPSGDGSGGSAVGGAPRAAAGAAAAGCWKRIDRMDGTRLHKKKREFVFRIENAAAHRRTQRQQKFPSKHLFFFLLSFSENEDLIKNSTDKTEQYFLPPPPPPLSMWQ